MGEIFDSHHLWYIFVSLAVTVGLLWLGHRFLKSSRGKDLFLKTFAFLTFFLHISIMWVEFLKNGNASAYDNILFPKYFCNFCMYLLMIVSLWENKKSKTFQAIAVFTAYGGFFGAMISLIYPDYYLGAPNMFEWGVFKSLLSHSTMLVGSLWIFVGGYIPIRRTNVILYSGGLLGCGALGLIVNWLFKNNGLPDPNAMYLQHPPLAEAPFLNAYTIAALMVLVIFLFTLIYEKATNEDQKPAKKWSLFFDGDYSK
jgi:Zn-dependent protease with chaperone function